VYDNEGHLLGEYDGAGTPIAEYAWLNDVPVAVLTPVGAGHGGQIAGGAEVFFVQPDHLDAPRVLVNDQAQVVWRWDAKPFGDTSPDQQPTAGLPSFEFNLRLPGQYADVELGQYYNYTRDYEPTTGRYLQSDSIGIEDDYATYTYVGDDPVGSVDPTGMGRCPKALRALGLCKKRPPKPKRPKIDPPVGGGIYIIRDCKDNIVYIGQTNNFGKRMNKHWGSGGQLSGFNSPCCPVTVEFRIEPVGPGLDRMERNLIRRHRPPGNTQHNPNPKPYTPPCCK
jgi:RHS repeat-associated protein